MFRLTLTARWAFILYLINEECFNVNTSAHKQRFEHEEQKKTMKLIMNGYCLLVSDIIFIFIFYGWVTLCWNNEIYLINRLWGTPSIGTIWVYKFSKIYMYNVLLCYVFNVNLINSKTYVRTHTLYDGRGHCYCCSETNRTKKNLFFKMIYYFNFVWTCVSLLLCNMKIFY